MKRKKRRKNESFKRVFTTQRTNLIVPVEVQSPTVAVDICCDLCAVVERDVLECADFLALGTEVGRLDRCDLASALVEVHRVARLAVVNLNSGF